jgi:large subunit ribosomal protein L6
MSRIGKLPVEIPSGVKALVEKGTVKVEGPKGKLAFALPKGIEVSLDANKLVARRKSDTAQGKAYHGLVRAQLFNMVKGVTAGYEKKLEIVGVGFRAAVKGKTLNLTLGYSHPVDFPIPEGITAKVENNTTVVLQSADKSLLGDTSAKVRALRPPEPYQGKGIKYSDEKIRRKAGKAAATGK